MVRLIRILNMGRLSRITDGFCFKSDQGRPVHSTTIVEALVSIVLMAHNLGCVSDFVGKTMMDAGHPNWLDPLDPDMLRTTAEAYSISLHWTLGHSTAAPVDSTVAPLLSPR